MRLECEVPFGVAAEPVLHEIELPGVVVDVRRPGRREHGAPAAGLVAGLVGFAAGGETAKDVIDGCAAGAGPHLFVAAIGVEELNDPAGREKPEGPALGHGRDLAENAVDHVTEERCNAIAGVGDLHIDAKPGGVRLDAHRAYQRAGRWDWRCSPQ